MSKAIRKPRNWMPRQSRELREHMAEMGLYPLQGGYELFVAKTARGWCNWNAKTVTVPLWAFNALRSHREIHGGNKRYFIYYACHEIAHSIAGPKANHGPEFMQEFMRICPKDLQHFELGYKPRNAAAAGIAK